MLLFPVVVIPLEAKPETANDATVLEFVCRWGVGSAFWTVVGEEADIVAGAGLFCNRSKYGPIILHAMYTVKTYIGLCRVSSLRGGRAEYRRFPNPFFRS